MEIQPPCVPDETEFLTVKQVAHYRNVSLGCVYRLCTTNKLAHYKFGDGMGRCGFAVATYSISSRAAVSRSKKVNRGQASSGSR